MHWEGQATGTERDHVLVRGAETASNKASNSFFSLSNKKTKIASVRMLLKKKKSAEVTGSPLCKIMKDVSSE